MWKGGQHDLANLQAMSVECHRRKSDAEAKERGGG
jgi:5-methylcytosine-specific restriction endonuclease McrA